MNTSLLAVHKSLLHATHCENRIVYVGRINWIFTSEECPVKPIRTELYAQMFYFAFWKIINLELN